MCDWLRFDQLDRLLTEVNQLREREKVA